MSGPVANNIFRSSGVIAAAAGGLSWQPVVTASTLSASAGNGYWINTTSNACTITLPGSAEAGDQIIFVDYARTWGTNAIIIDSNGLNFQGEPDTYTVDYDTSGQAVNLVYSGATIGWTPSSDIVNALEPVGPTQAIFAYGATSSPVSVSNKVSTSGVVASDTTGVGTARVNVAGAEYGGDKGIFGFGNNSGGRTAVTNLVSNSGVIGTDVSGVGNPNSGIAATRYGGDKAIFGFGSITDGVGTKVSTTNLVSNSGVVASNTTGVGTARSFTAAAGYGIDKALFGYGQTSPSLSMTNLVSNTGVVSSDTTGVGTARHYLAAASYGTDKALFGYGLETSNRLSMTNLVSNSGVVATDTTGVGTARYYLEAAGYGFGQAIFGFGNSGSLTNISNLVNSSGVVGNDVTGVGTSREGLGATSFG